MEEKAPPRKPISPAGAAGDPAQDQEQLAEELRAEWEATI